MTAVAATSQNEPAAFSKLPPDDSFFRPPTRQLQTDNDKYDMEIRGRDIPAMLISPNNQTANIVPPTCLFRPDWRMAVPSGQGRAMGGKGLQEVAPRL